MSRGLDVACARALGWTWHEMSAYSPSGSICANDGKHEWAWLEHYSTDHVAARQLEDEIERRGLQRRYILVLSKIIAVGDSRIGTTGDFYIAYEWTEDSFWTLWRATPEQRARAFLEAVKGE